MCVFFFFVKQKTAYEMRISDWSSDVCSSDLGTRPRGQNGRRRWCAIHHQGAARGVEEVIAVAATIAKAVIIGFGARIEWARLAAFGIPARMHGIPAIGIADRSIPVMAMEIAQIGRAHV